MCSLYQSCIAYLFTSLFSDRVLQRKRVKWKRTRSKVLILRPVDVKQTKKMNNQPRMSQSTLLTIQIPELKNGQNVTSSAKKDTSTRTKAIKKYFSNATPTLTERARRAKQRLLQGVRVRDLCSGLSPSHCIRGRWVCRYIIINHSSLICSLHYFLTVFCSANV